MSVTDGRKRYVTAVLYSIAICLAGCSTKLQAMTLSQERAAVQDSGCGTAEKHLGQLISFLDDQNTERTQPKCIEEAIEALGSARAESGIPILLRYLDFAEPLSAEEEEHRVFVASSHFGPRYKAVTALEKIGTSALPFLIKLINDPATPSLKLKNALASYVAINRENLIGSLSALKASAASELCPLLRQADNDALIAFLEKNREAPSPDSSGCIGFAILQLGISKSVPAKKVLLSYLQYQWLSNEPQEQGTDLHSCPICHNQRFPAVTAFALIGATAAPDLLELLKDGSAPDVTSQNAVEAIMLIYSDYPQHGIEVIRSYADRQDRAAKARLEAVAHSAQKWCDASHASSCRVPLAKP